jgi:S-disulfanyl-L-cysteine oxidoreductase SoxD
MSSSPERWLKAALAVAVLGLGAQALAQGQASYPGIGRTATPREVAAWDIDVRPDFKGLPKGSGSVAKGMEVWEGKCASCHGIFGESNEVFSPLVGGTTAQDIQTGRVARLMDGSFPGRTTLMKVSSISTLWDYINRAMPWNAPKSLTVEEVYAVTAYLLNMGNVLPESFVLSDRNMAEAQARLPNRNGMSTDHGLWPGKGLGNGGKPDVRPVACMKDCEAEPKVASFLPDFARNNHGNLAEQQRPVGPQRGADTTRPAPTSAAAAAAAATAAPRAAPPAAAPTAAPAGAGGGAAALALAAKHSCTACHGVANKIVGPGLQEIAAKYAGRADAQAYLQGKIKSGGQGVWGAIPMPPQSLPDNDAKVLAEWLATGAKK